MNFIILHLTFFKKHALVVPAFELKVEPDKIPSTKEELVTFWLKHNAAQFQ